MNAIIFGIAGTIYGGIRFDDTDNVITVVLLVIVIITGSISFLIASSTLLINYIIYIRVNKIYENDVKEKLDLNTTIFKIKKYSKFFSSSFIEDFIQLKIVYLKLRMEKYDEAVEDLKKISELNQKNKGSFHSCFFSLYYLSLIYYLLDDDMLNDTISKIENLVLDRNSILSKNKNLSFDIYIRTVMAIKDNNKEELKKLILEQNNNNIEDFNFFKSILEK